MVFIQKPLKNMQNHGLVHAEFFKAQVARDN